MKNIFATVSDERQQQRLGICSICEHKIQATNMCAKCGCFLSMKVMLASAECPELRWTSEQ